MLGYYYYTSKIKPYLTEPEKSAYTLGSLTFLVIIFFGFLIFKPLLASTVKIYSELRAGSTYETALAEKLIALDQAKRSLASIANQIDNLEEVVPQGSSQSDLIQELSEDAGQAGVTLDTISFEKPEGATNSIPFNLFATGPTESLTLLLEELEKGRLISLKELKATSRQDEKQGTWDITIKGGALFIP